MIEDYNLEQEENEKGAEGDNVKLENDEIKSNEEVLQNPFSVNQNTEKEAKNIFEMMQNDSKKKRKMVNFNF